MMTLAEFGTLQYDSLFAPQNFWRDYDAMPADAQHDADGMLWLDALFGCWTPPPREDQSVTPVVDTPAPPQWTEQVVVVDTPWTPPPITPPAVPEPATWALLALGLIALMLWGRCTRPPKVTLKRRFA